MNRRTNGTRWVCVAILIPFITAGCAPLISQEVLREVDPGIRFEDLLGNPDVYQGRTMLLGGDIIETQTLPKRTLLIVLQRPLGFRKKPVHGGASIGRFIVSVPGFLDPAIYRPRRKVTVVGSVAGKEVRPLGQITYTYPLIAKRELYLWPVEEPHMREPRVHFGVGIGIGF
jgi:outer membrane lipoprotein